MSKIYPNPKTLKLGSPAIEGDNLAQKLFGKLQPGDLVPNPGGDYTLTNNRQPKIISLFLWVFHVYNSFSFSRSVVHRR